MEQLLEAPIAHLGCRLLEAQYRHEGRWVLRLVIDKPPAALMGTPELGTAPKAPENSMGPEAPEDNIAPGAREDRGVPEATVTLDDCGRVSEVAGRILDVEDPIPQAFALEVTSPGLFRPLKERRHFEQSLGRLCRFTLAPGVLPERKERTLRGIVAAVTDGGVTMAVDGERIAVPLEAIRGARLDPDL